MSPGRCCSCIWLTRHVREQMWVRSIAIVPGIGYHYDSVLDTLPWLATRRCPRQILRYEQLTLHIPEFSMMQCVLQLLRHWERTGQVRSNVIP